MTEEERKELYRKCVAKLDELENNGLDLGDWSIEDAYTEGAIFGCEIAEEEIEDWKACHEHQLELMKGLNDRIADLENTNANLRGIVKNMGACMPNCRQFRQLEQAKQIIKDILLDSEKWDYKDLMFKPLREQAEQFIKEIEK